MVKSDIPHTNANIIIQTLANTNTIHIAKGTPKPKTTHVVIERTMAKYIHATFIIPINSFLRVDKLFI